MADSSTNSRMLQVTTNRGRTFTDMINTMAKDLQPSSYREAYQWAVELWLRCPPYRTTITRGAAYFLTELFVSAKDGRVDVRYNELTRAKTKLNNLLVKSDQAHLVLQEALGFGGAVVYLHFPILKMLHCDCGRSVNVEEAVRNNGARLTEHGKYKGRCPGCRKETSFEVKQYRVRDGADGARLRRIPLALCKMEASCITGDKTLYLDCGSWESLQKEVRDNNPTALANTLECFVQAAREKRLLKLSNDYFHYLGFEDVTAIDMYMDGWCLPPFFYAFPDVVAVLLLQHYNELMLSDYIKPKRYVAPPPTVGASRVSSAGQHVNFDPTHSVSAADFKSLVSGMLNELEENPDKIGVSPFPLHSGYVGSSPNDLVSIELMRYYVRQLIQNMGAPGIMGGDDTATRVAAPVHYEVAMMERQWGRFIPRLNDMFNWCSDRIQSEERGPALDVRLVPPAKHVTPEMLMLYNQLRYEGRLSEETFARMVWLDDKFEELAVEHQQERAQERYMSKDRKEQRKGMIEEVVNRSSPVMQAYESAMMVQDAAQAEQMQAMSGTAVPPGGAGPDLLAQAAGPAPGPAAGAAPSGPAAGGTSLQPHQQKVMEDIMNQARTDAQLFMAYPVQERAVMLDDLTASMPQYSMFVQKAIDEAEDSMRKQGLMMGRDMMAQQQGAGAMAPAAG